jgi:hypothetical protein
MVDERLMEMCWIVKGFDVLKRRYSGFIAIHIARKFGPFMRQ